MNCTKERDENIGVFAFAAIFSGSVAAIVFGGGYYFGKIVGIW